MIKRRSVLAGLAAGSLILPFASIVRADCLVTGAQPEGPFYPIISAGEQDNDLTRVAGRTTRAAGEIIRISGHVLNDSCNPIPGSSLEIWQANSAGRYFHPQDTSESRPLDPNFQGYARIQTDNSGRYSFVSIRPGSYKVTKRWVRPPHIHFRVRAPGGFSFTTQMYFADEPFNETDYLLQELDLTQRRGLIVSLHQRAADGIKDGTFNLVI